MAGLSMCTGAGRDVSLLVHADSTGRVARAGDAE